MFCVWWTVTACTVEYWPRLSLFSFFLHFFNEIYTQRASEIRNNLIAFLTRCNEWNKNQSELNRMKFNFEEEKSGWDGTELFNLLSVNGFLLSSLSLVCSLLILFTRLNFFHSVEQSKWCTCTIWFLAIRKHFRFVHSVIHFFFLLYDLLIFM